MHKKYYLYLCCQLLLNAIYGQPAELSGRVLNAQKMSLPGVKLTLLNKSDSTISDTEGYFVFKGINSSMITVVAQLPGYREYRSVVQLSKGNNNVEIILYPHITELEEVIVRDNRIRLRKEEESLNIEVIRPDFIQRHLGGSLMKTLERLPGVKTIGIGSGQSKPLVRGMGFNRVLVFDKGVKHEAQQWGADHGLELDQFAAGEIELIKGAASFAYGSDAIAGVIDVKPESAPPMKTIGGSVDITGKTNNQLYGGSARLYARSRKWFAATRLTWQDYSDYRVPADTVHVYSFAAGLHKNYLRNTAGRESAIHIAAGYLADHFRSIFHISNVYSKAGFFANAHGLEPRRVNMALHDRSARDILEPFQQVQHFKLINRSAFEWKGHHIELDIGYQRNFRHEFNRYVNHGYMPPVYPDTLDIPSNLEREFKKQVYSFNLKDKFILGNHTLTAGINGEYQHNEIGGWSFLIPSFRQSAAGAFIYDKMQLNDRWFLHGALRYDYGNLQMQRYSDWFPSQVTNEATEGKYLTRAENISRTFHSWVWSAGLNYNQRPFSLKLNIGKSFRMPIAKELSANGVNYHYFSYEKGDVSLAAEQSYQIDLSVVWETSRWSVQVSPFYNYFPNYIYLNPTASHDYYYGAGNQVFQYSQSKVFRYGAEILAKYKLLKALTAELSGEYLYAEQLSGNKKGYTLPFSPPPSGLFNLTWSPQWKGNFSKIYFSLDYRVTARQNNIVPTEKKTAAYNLFNFQAGSRIKIAKQSLQIGVQVQNILNTRYLNHTSFYRLIELPEQGRNIILTIKVPFIIKSDERHISLPSLSGS